MTIPGRRRSEVASLGEATPGSEDAANRPHGVVRKLVIAVAVVIAIAIAVAGGTTVSAVLKNPVVPLISRLDYQTGNFSQWTEQQRHRFEQEAIVTSPARRGYPHTARFTVAPGDYTNGGTTAERSEVMASVAQTGNPAQGQTMWFAWSTFIPAGTRVDSNATSPVGDGWLIFTQWHGTSNTGGNPNIDFSLTKGAATPHLVLDTEGGSGRSTAQQWVQSTAFPLGRWNDFTVGVVWGESSSVGRITVKINGTTWVDNASCANLFTGQSSYFKQGIYRASSAQTQTIYHTGTRIGPTEDSVTRETCMTSPGNDVPILGFFRRLACRWRS